MTNKKSLQQMTVEEMFDYCKHQGDKVYKVVNTQIAEFKNGNIDKSKMDRIHGLGKSYKKLYMTALNNQVRKPYTAERMQEVVRTAVKIRKEIANVLGN